MAKTDFEARFKKLNKEQRQAVETIEGPLLVVAGPGSGKTEILSLRIGQILKETQARASNILCLTFTEAAAVNMRKRLASLIGEEAYRVAIHTFHNFCVEIIQRFPEYFYSGAFFKPADELTQVQILQGLFEKLPAQHLLRAEHPEQGFVYLRDAKKAIGCLKKAGLEPDDFLAILKHNGKVIKEIDAVLNGALGERLSKKNLTKITAAANQLEILAEKVKGDFPSDYFLSLPSILSLSLRKALTEAENQDETKPLSEWKAKWLKKDDNNESVFKDSLYLEKMTAFADLYRQYRKALYDEGYYDFDDMILDVLSVLEKNPAVRYELQEQYQYVLVDEFQDTNDAQMRILKYISDAPVYEGKPNIMAVGDDDQAIYKFQGAELSNILNFKRMFQDVAVITMTKNYRSTQDVLDVAEHIIKKGEERLEKILPEIEKNLIASNTELEAGSIDHKEFSTRAHEYHFISREIKKRIDAGEKPEEIAVIARKHWQLSELVPYLRGVKVPIRYEREQNVFQEPHIAQLILLARFLSSLLDKYSDEADELLPNILAFPFWNLEREAIWQISLAARRGNSEKTWLEVMKESKDKKIVGLSNFLIELGAKARVEPLEMVLDELIGSHLPLSPEAETDEADEEIVETKKKDKFVSPFREYYFSQDRFEHARAEYLSFLSSLRVFVNALREYKNGEVLTVRDLVEFVDLHEKNDISLNDQSPFARLSGAVNLLTAHGAKGLEFETVFVLSCQDQIWAGRSQASKLVLPANLPIEPAGENEDDQLRLFYVAITRAKRHLYLTTYEIGEDGKNSSKLRFLTAESAEKESFTKKALQKVYQTNPKVEAENLPETHEVLTASWLNFHTAPFLGEEKKLLLSLVEDYKMSVTHLNNFLNITKGGPQYFLEQNLLRFPQAKIVSGSYGSAIHYTLEQIAVYLKKEGQKPAITDILKWFEKNLRHERLAPRDYSQHLERGQTALTKFWQEKQAGFSAEDWVEFNFREEGVVIDGAVLSGKIDRIIKRDGGRLEVLDYKTGKAKNKWEGKDDYEKTKLAAYEKQLYYYKLLVENSRTFGDKYKVEKGLLQFVEPKNEQIITLELTLEAEKTERLKKLISVVYKKIKTLDLPDISKYKKDFSGIKEFEEDLLKGAC